MKPVRRIAFMLCTKLLLLRNFVPQKESFENIFLRIFENKLIVFSQVKVKLKLYNHYYDLQKQDTVTSNLPLKKACFNAHCMSV